MVREIMYKKALLSLCGVLLFCDCTHVSTTMPTSAERFYLEYAVSGGFAGMHNVFVVTEDDSAKYVARNFKFATHLEEQHLDKIYISFIYNSFFSLREEYLPKTTVKDDIVYTITFRTGGRSKKVIASGYAGFPKGFSEIKRSLDDVIEDLKKNINSGKVVISSESILEEWPFSNSVKLSDHLSQKVFVEEEIFNHFKNYYRSGKNVVYFEGEWIYRLNTSDGYALTHNKLKEFSISIHGRRKPFQWLPEIGKRLADIPPEGIFIFDANYRKIRDYFSNNYYPWYFIEDELKTGSPVYQIELTHGNNR